MCLLDAVTRWDTAAIECLAHSHLAPDNPLRSEGRLPVQAGIEYAAQAMAVHGGLLEAGGGEPRRGYLAVLTDIRWWVERLDDRAGPLRILASRQTVIAGGACYAFSVREAEQLLLEGSAVVAFG